MLQIREHLRGQLGMDCPSRTPPSGGRRPGRLHGHHRLPDNGGYQSCTRTWIGESRRASMNSSKGNSR